MAEKQASYIQASSHPADTDRLVLEGLLNPSPAPVSGAGYGVGPTAGDLLVVQNGTPNMSVNVGAGHVWIDGTESATQGAYHGYNDATKNLVVAASDPTNARKDLVVAKVQDAAYSGAVNAWTLAVVTGTPAASPAEPTVPANAVVLAMINVAALATTITNANITDRRRRACGLSGVAVCTSTTRPAAPYVGQIIYETDTGKVWVWDGTNWTYPKNVAGGTLGYAQVVADQLGIGAGPTDLTGLTTTVTVTAGRRIKITGHGRMQMSDAATGYIVNAMADGVAVGDVWIGESIGGRLPMNGFVVLTPSAGSHTYKLTASRFIGSGTLGLTAAAANPAFILVEDIGV